jgi:hypothetical protein
MSGLRVAYCGNFKPSHSTETHLARTLTQMGHTVTRLQEDDLSPDGLTQALQRMDRPDMFLFTRTWGHTVTEDHLSWLRSRGIPSVSYHLDLYVPLQRNGGIDTDPFWRTDFVFTPDGNPRSAAEFQRRGINHRHILPGVVADECYVAEGVCPKRDVIFVGSGPGYHSEWGYRGELLRWLASTYGQRFSHYGGRGQAIRGYALNRLYASAKVVVGDSLVVGFDWEGYCSDRRFETPGRGGFMVHPRIAGLDDGYVEGVNTAFYDFNDWSGLRDRIDHYLAHDAERERIRRAGHEHVKAHHTYTHRLTAMLDLLRVEGAL